MNKVVFRLLVFLMSLSLIGIILVQVYWFNTSLENNEEQFRFHIKQVLGNVADKLQKKDEFVFYERYKRLKDSLGKEPQRNEILRFGYYQQNPKTKETIIYTNSILAEDFGVLSTFFENDSDSLNLKKFSAKRKIKVYNNSSFEDMSSQNNNTPDLIMNKEGDLKILENVAFQIAYKDISSSISIDERISKNAIQDLLVQELKEYDVTTPFEFCIYSNGLATKIKSENFKFDKYATNTIPIFLDNENNSKYQLLITFPQKKKYLFGKIIGISLLSIVFTLIIIIAYSNALSQLFKQRQISEIKTDFINNMTHEFKTPIATINLALDAIKNPKVIDDKEKVFRYLQMIKDENKRMHAQVENVLRISKLEKKELEILKESHNVNEIINDAIEHIKLIIEDRNGIIRKNLNATRNTVLLSEVHFTNVIVNVLDNAIKYSVNEPVIDISTENIKEFIIIKIKDQGIGMSKNAQKQIFEKFFREHTGDVHNVKGHGLGLAYVKKIVNDHNGQIFVESEKGKGSTFTIKLPLIN
jgi:two-component system phosphate regulon sensor histidine kinase PhoR